MGRTKTATLALLVLLAVILGYLWQAGWLGHPPRPAAGPLEKVTVNIDYSGFNALLWIAQDRGFDRDQGLQLNLQTYQTGQEALAHLAPGGLSWPAAPSSSWCARSSPGLPIFAASAW